ncbi:MAG: hypothetical protein DRO88_12420 [Promethearchaeia archaeon]|nr:MAG: hypothetical protein DRO88_12420 [Candidatus Lokiarchaeia archaeon]
MASSAIYCSICGFKNDQFAIFCQGCGEKLIHENSPAQREVYSENIQNQNNEIQFSSFGDRLIAFIIDSILFDVVVSVIGFALGKNWIFGMGTHWSDSIPGVIFGFLYFFLFEAYNHGQTPGKMLLKIKTVDSKTFGDISLQQAVIHSIGKNLFLIIDLILALFMKEKPEDAQEENRIRFTQRLAQTSVISLKV